MKLTGGIFKQVYRGLESLYTPPLSGILCVAHVSTNNVLKALEQAEIF